MSKRKIKLTEEKLVEELKAQTKVGCEALYDMYSKTLFAVLFKIVNDADLADDLLQQSLVKIWYSAGSYSHTRGRLFTWMITITRNVARDCLRGKQYHQSQATDPIEFHADYADQNNTVFLNTDMIGMKQWVDALKKEHREVLSLIYFKGYTHAEVSEELQIPCGTVKTRYRVALAILKARFNEPASKVMVA